jgi:hypothetical protein
MLTSGGGAADTTSMVSSTGHFARREIRRRRRAFRNHWPLVTAITLGLSAVTVSVPKTRIDGQESAF